MHNSELKVLHIEDDFADAMLLQHALHEAGAFDLVLEVVRTLKDARLRLERKSYDLIILDLRLPDSVNPEDTVRTTERAAGQTPILVLTGSARVDASAIGPHIMMLDKNEFFHGRDREKSKDLLKQVRVAVDGALHI